ncbi:MAG TPA: UDP-3-O-acyl-N-acetylglucosamine deacetylase, partial [Terriglobales bacterium]|nr:UDP-3-O-acyl-N-acetylglucosamine deacetylase [Terriglobales bacterium]
MIYEQTIRASAECKGVGLHSGAPVHLKILPAASGTGIVFRRTDLDGFELEAVSRNVARVSYATSLMKKGVLISTTEHLLSAFVGMGIDNAIVELDNLELPILDGSAQPFVDLIRRAGIRKQRRARSLLKVLRPIELREGSK